MTQAVIVAGHAIFRDNAADPLADDAWVLQPFQQGEGRYFVEHIEQGVALAVQNLDALLIFSGGQTRAEAGPRSEAESYCDVAQHYGWWGHLELAARTITEEFARDSYENLLYSLQRFRQHTGDWPAHITLVSWRFKQPRFELHREAIGWPAERFSFLGANNPPTLDLASEARTVALYQNDPHGTSPQLDAKKQARDPFRRQHPYGRSRLEAWPCLKDSVKT